MLVHRYESKKREINAGDVIEVKFENGQEESKLFLVIRELERDLGTSAYVPNTYRLLNLKTCSIATYRLNSADEIFNVLSGADREIIVHDASKINIHIPY